MEEKHCLRRGAPAGKELIQSLRFPDKSMLVTKDKLFSIIRELA